MRIDLSAFFIRLTENTISNHLSKSLMIYPQFLILFVILTISLNICFGQATDTIDTTAYQHIVGTKLDSLIESDGFNHRHYGII